MVRFWPLLGAIFLVGCAHAPPPPDQVWVRTDGQRADNNPVLAHQFEIDKTICVGDTQNTNLSSLTPVEVNKYSYGLNAGVEAQRAQASLDAMKGCMAQKGYLAVPVDQAETVRQQFAATAAQRAATQNPPPPTQAADPKKKPPTSQ